MWDTWSKRISYAHGAAKPLCRNYWAHVWQLLKPMNPRSHALQQEKPLQWEACTLQLESSPHSPQLEKSSCSNRDPAQPKINARKTLQSGPTLCHPMDCSLLGSSVHGILQEYWSGLPFPPPGDLPDPGIECVSLVSPALAGRFFTTSTTWEAQNVPQIMKKYLETNENGNTTYQNL